MIDLLVERALNGSGSNVYAAPRSRVPTSQASFVSASMATQVFVCLQSTDAQSVHKKHYA